MGSDSTSIGVAALAGCAAAGFLALLARNKPSKSRVVQYLNVLGYSDTEASMIIDSPPSLPEMADLIKRHIRKIPFNNMGMHKHPATASDAEVPQKLPTLDGMSACSRSR